MLRNVNKEKQREEMDRKEKGIVTAGARRQRQPRCGELDGARFLGKPWPAIYSHARAVVGWHVRRRYFSAMGIFLPVGRSCPWAVDEVTREKVRCLGDSNTMSQRGQGGKATARHGGATQGVHGHGDLAIVPSLTPGGRRRWQAAPTR
jgi:hypothetical protein